MAMQYTSPYNLPYPQIGDPVREGAAAIQGIAQAVNTALVNGSFPASNPDVASMTARLNALEANSLRRMEFKNASLFNVPANTPWGTGPLVGDVTNNRSKGAGFATVGPGNDKITINENGWYNFSLYIIPAGSPGISWCAITVGGSDRIAQGGNNGNMWECMTVQPVPVYVAAGTPIVFSYVSTADVNINSRITVAKIA